MRTTVASLVLLLSMAALPAATDRSERSGEELRDRSLDFDGSGLQVGDTVPDLELLTLAGDTVPLSALWLDRPTVLVTGSITCPVSRRRMRQVDRMRNHFGDAVHVALLYTLEAHPKGAGSPYSIGRVEWLTKANIGQKVLFPQPETLDGRHEHALEFIDRLETATPLYLDNMDNEIWRALGSGPNVGVLIGVDGKIQVKHGWFDGGTMYRSVEAYLDAESPGWRDGRPAETSDRRSERRRRRASGGR